MAATPGLKVVVPSDPQSAYGLLRSAIRDDDPTVVLEPRALYAERGEVVTGDEGIMPLGKARVARSGNAATVVTLGQTTGVALKAADSGSLDIEVIDLLTIYPWDRQAVLDSVRRTGRLVVVEESPDSGGWGHEIVSSVTSSVFGSLQAAPFRISAPNVPVPYNKELEALYLPSVDEVTRQLSHYLKTDEVPDPWWVREGVAR